MSEPSAPKRSRTRGIDTDATRFDTVEAEALAEAATNGSPVAPSPDTIVRVEGGGIAEATAGKVEVTRGGIGTLDAQDVFVEWGGIGAARADRVSVEFGGLGAALAGDIRVSQGYAGAVAAREAVIEQAVVRTLVAQHVTINRPSAVLVLIAQKVTGDVRPVLDWRGALAFGAAFGLISAVASAVRRTR
ncbi:MAG: hypothetical protein ABIR11_04690 [Candidatus Limnocylindrales bacterium]